MELLFVPVLLAARADSTKPHPVRGYFNDPRISGTSRAFHFGVDISAPNGTSVAVERQGTVTPRGRPCDLGGRPARVASSATGTLSRPSGTCQKVGRHELTGSHRSALAARPLRRAAGRQVPQPAARRGPSGPGATRHVPASDAGGVRARRDRNSTSNRRPRRSGRDRRGVRHAAGPRCRGPWNDLPVTPAPPTLARPPRPRRSCGPGIHLWTSAETLLPQSALPAASTPPGDAADHAGEPPAFYRFFLAHTWSTTTLPDGPYRLEVEASDLYGNKGGLQLAVHARERSLAGKEGSEHRRELVDALEQCRRPWRTVQMRVGARCRVISSRRGEVASPTADSASMVAGDEGWLLFPFTRASRWDGASIRSNASTTAGSNWMPRSCRISAQRFRVGRPRLLVRPVVT